MSDNDGRKGSAEEGSLKANFNNVIILSAGAASRHSSVAGAAIIAFF
jgi:hypothetical protein